jgi:hypothetical protein
MLAQAAGLPPLSMMEGFCNVKGHFCEKSMKEIDDIIPPDKKYGDSPMAYARGIIWQLYLEKFELPIKWDYYKNDPLTILLNHSDCEGDIKCKDCEPLADRLQRLIDDGSIPDGSGGGHIGKWREKTQQFIDGLRLAAKQGENVEFH